VEVVEGRQEDAEEFLTCLLNGVSDEMAAGLKAHLQAVEAAHQERTQVHASPQQVHASPLPVHASPLQLHLSLLFTAMHQ